MKNTYYKLLIVMSLFIVSCSTLKTPSVNTTTTKEKIIKEIPRDTIIEVAKDSSFYKAWIKCVNNKPVLVAPKKSKSIDTVFLPEAKPGKFLEPPKVNLKGNVLSVDCHAKAQKLFIQWKEKYIQENTVSETTITLPPKLIEKKLSWWQKLWIGLGKIAGLALIIWLASKISWKNLFRLLIRLVKRV